MAYPDCYVGTISLGANYQHTINVLKEAEQYNGPSIVIAYAPCIAHGIKTGMKDSITEEKLATESGYFPLFKYNPETKEYKLVSKANFDKYEDFLNNENRYKSNKELLEKNKQTSQEVYNDLEKFEDGAVVTPELLKEMGILKKQLAGVKVLGNGNLTKKLTVKASKFSASAVEKIELYKIK